MHRVIVVGAANVDLEAAISGPVALGDSNIATFRRGAGGVGRNIAENLARLDVPVALLTVFDDGPDGRWLAAHTAAAGVDVDAALHLPDAASTYLAVVDADGELVIGANDMRAVAHVDADMIDDRWDLLAIAEVVVVDANLPTATIRHLAATFPASRLVAEPVSAAKAQRLRPHLGWLDLVKPNRGELAALADHTIAGPADVDPAIDELLRLGVGTVCVSLGEHGVVIATPDERLRLPAIAAPVVSVTGAGDAMTAGLVLGLLDDADLRGVARRGQAMAALTAAVADTVATDITNDRLRRLLETHP